MARKKNGNHELGLRGFVRAVALDANGEVVCERRSKNVVVDQGVTEIIKRISTLANTNFIAWGAIGTSSTTESVTHTNVLGTIASSFKSVAVGGSTVSAGGTVQYTWSYTTNEVNNPSIQEVALFATNAAGTMYARSVHGLISKTTDMTLNYTYELQLATA
jgi:hypothetical protein